MHATPSPRTPHNAAFTPAIVWGGAIMGLALGIRHVQGLFLVPMTTAHGWSREAFGFAIAVQNLCWGLAQPFTGMLADRYGSVRVIMAGTLLYLAGLACMACASTPLALTLSGGLVIGVALACTAFGTIYGAIARIVPPERRSAALGLAGSLGGLGQFVMVPLAQELLQWVGVACALVGMGVAIALLTPSARALDDRATGVTAVAEDSSSSLRAALRQAFGHRGFWLLNIGFGACGFQLAFIASHLPAYLLDRGLTAREGVAALAIIALANIASMIAFGAWGGIYRRKLLLAALYLARTAAMALFLVVPLSPASVYAFCAAMGFLWLGAVPLTNGIVSGVFGVRYLATLFGFAFFGHQLGAFLGVWLGGAVYDATHSYDLVWAIAMGLGVVSALLHLFIDDRPVVALAPPRLQPA